MIFIRIKPFPIFHLFLLLHLLLTTVKPAFQRSVSSSATGIHTAISSEIAFLVFIGVNAGSIHNLCSSTFFIGVNAGSIHNLCSSTFFIGVNAGSIHNICYSTRSIFIIFLLVLFFSNTTASTFFNIEISIQTLKRVAELGHVRYY